MRANRTSLKRLVGRLRIYLAKAMTALINSFDNTLRSLLRGAALPEHRIVRYVLLSGAFYGALMGTFGGFGGHLSGWQMLFSAIKVPSLLLITFALCLPAFFVINALVGVAEDFVQARRALLLAQATLSVVLASLSPFTLLFYASSNHYQAAILFNLLMFAVASMTAQVLLRRLYAPLIERDARHTSLLRLWLALFSFTAVQLAYVLRPFVGDPMQPVSILRSGAWDNAYVVLLQMVVKVIGGT